MTQIDELKKFVRDFAGAFLAILGGAMLCTTAVYAIFGEPDISRVESPFLIAKNRLMRADPGFNAAFLGSSLTFRQIDPEIFDTELGDLQQIRSYNLGNDGFYMPRSIDFLDYTLATAPAGLDTIIVELLRLDEITVNYDAPEIMRSTGYRPYYQAVRTILVANFPRSYKLWMVGQYTRSFVYKFLGFGLINYYTLERELKPQHLERLAVAERGFYAKDVELLQSRDEPNLATLKAVRATLAGHPERVEERRQLHLDKYKMQWSLTPNPFVDRLLDSIVRAEQKGIRVIFFLPPLLDMRGVSFAYPVWLMLPEYNRLDLSDPRAVPELYKYDNLFDLEHVNSVGAWFFSQYLADAYRNKLLFEAEPANKQN